MKFLIIPELDFNISVALVNQVVLRVSLLEFYVNKERTLFLNSTSFGVWLCILAKAKPQGTADGGVE